MEEKRKAGRPPGAKDKAPRKTEKRAKAMMASLAESGHAAGNLHSENLAMLDWYIDSLYRDIQRAEELVNQDMTPEDTGLSHNDHLNYLRRVQDLRKELLAAIDRRHKAATEIAKYTEYTKGQEKIVKDEESGEYVSLQDRVQQSGPLLEG